jgi:L-ascorbate metabolism protein UlaG (beta-lactamase superfamily)
MCPDALRLTYVGHATVLVDLDGTRILTDPLLRERVAHLFRYGPAPDRAGIGSPDAILLSHMHRDHCDIPSLLQLGRHTRLVVPEGGGKLLARRGFSSVEEMRPGNEIRLGPLTVTATDAEHSGFRPPSGPQALALGFLIGGTRRVYFAGDTDLFEDMTGLSAGLDLALLPIWGWGRVLGPGHLDPTKAALALRMLRPSIAVPIHWGTFARVGLAHASQFLTEPPTLFSREASRLAPEVEVRIVRPGESVGLFT